MLTSCQRGGDRCRDSELASEVVLALLLMSAMVTSGPTAHEESRLQSLAAIAISLYGDTSGWGFTPGSITSPGPTITVDQFDEVQLRLEGMDGPPHNFYVDYNRNGNPDPPAEPVSPDFRNSSGPISYSFFANTPGTFTYYCAYHQSNMLGSFVVRTTNTPPTGRISMPDGAQDWTGGSVHRIWWNMSDAQDANPALTVYLNYSSASGSGPIVGPRAGTGNPNFHDWALPPLDASDVVANLTVVDSAGLKAWDETLLPVIDSIPPGVAATVPAPDAADVPRTTTIQVTWTESMNAAVTGSLATFGLRAFPSGPWVPGTFVWNAPEDTLMTFIPGSPLDPGTQYEAIVNISARDDSDPGNAFPAAYAWTFTTGTVVDTQPPQISAVAVSPPVQSIGGSVNVSAILTDNVAVSGVWLNVTSPSASAPNVTMARGTGNAYYVNRIYGETGVHVFVLWASDTSGLWNSASGQFTIRDDAPPIITHTPPTSLSLGEPLNVTATVVDAGGIAQVELNWTDVSGRTTNSSMVRTGDTYSFVIAMQLRTGTLEYFVWAQDSSGNAAMTPVVRLQVQAPAGTTVLYGDTGRGWGYGPDNMTSPGPTIRVPVGATVRLLLIPADALRHNLFVDYDADRAPGAGEPLSDDFMDQAVTFTFLADRSGTFTYYCEYHPGTMRGTFTVGEAAAPEELSPLWLVIGFGVPALIAIVAAVILLRRRRSGKRPET